MEAPEPIEVARFPNVVVSACVVSRCVYTSVVKCVLQRAHSVGATPCVHETPSVKETPCVSSMARVSEQPRVSEARCVRETACVRSLCVREMTVGMREHATTCPSVMAWCVSVVTRRCA